MKSHQKKWKYASRLSLLGLFYIFPSQALQLDFSSNYTYIQAKIVQPTSGQATIILMKKNGEKKIIVPTHQRLEHFKRKLDLSNKKIPPCLSTAHTIKVSTGNHVFNVCGSRQRALIFNALRKLENSSPAQ